MTPPFQPPHTLLEQLIQRDPRSYEQLAEQLEALSWRHHIEGSIGAKHLARLARKERPHSTCRPETRQLLEKLFRRGFEDLFGPPETHSLPLDLATSSSVPLLESVDGIAQFASRVLAQPEATGQLEVVPAAWSELAAGWFIDPDDDAAAVGNPNELTTADVQVVEDATKMFSSFDYRYGGGHSRLLVVQCLASDALPRLRHASTASPLGRKYFSAAAGLTRLAAWSAYDTGQHGVAQMFFALALRFAKAAGDRALGGRILAGMSHQANFLGEFQKAVDLARAAHRGARGLATPTAMALFHAMEARGLASLGQEAECTKALLSAEGWMAQSKPDNDPSWIHYFDDAELHAEFAHCFRDLSRPELSAEHAELSLANAGDVYVRSKGFVTTVVATSHLQRGDVEHALSVAQGVVDAAQQLQSRRIIAYLNEFRQLLIPYRSDGRVRQFEDYVRGHVPGSERLPASNGLSVA